MASKSQPSKDEPKDTKDTKQTVFARDYEELEKRLRADGVDQKKIDVILKVAREEDCTAHVRRNYVHKGTSI
jgi:hypothetical protein